MRVELSGEADADLDSIAEYTIREHGPQQARNYVGSLVARIEALALEPVGRRTDGLDPAVLRIRHGAHFLFFRVHTDRVTILRVLHVRQDAVRHLG